MVYALSLAAVLFVFWILLSGFFTAFLLTMGVACAVGVTLLARRMEVVDREGHPIHEAVNALWYWPWLLKEVAKSAWQVSRIIVAPRLPISPTLVRVAPSQKTPVGLVTHANSITLTPGTISVEAGREEFLVHGLTRAGAEGCVASQMDRLVTRFEGSE